MSYSTALQYITAHAWGIHWLEFIAFFKRNPEAVPSYVVGDSQEASLGGSRGHPLEDGASQQEAFELSRGPEIKITNPNSQLLLLLLQKCT